jgi:hypothetical protein
MDVDKENADGHAAVSSFEDAAPKVTTDMRIARDTPRAQHFTSASSTLTAAVNSFAA